jgi:hypothetical protein
MKTGQANTKICPSCGRSFHCSGDEDCWCENFRINKKELLLVMSKFNDCICPDCLGKYEEPVGSKE